MEYVGFLLYTLSEYDDEPETVIYGLLCMGFYAELARKTDSNVGIEDAKRIANAHCLEHIGVEKLLLRFKRSLSDPDSLNFPALRVCLQCLWILSCPRPR